MAEMVKWIAFSHKNEKALEEGKCLSAKASFNAGRVKEWAYDELRKGRVVKIKRSDTDESVTLRPEDAGKTIALP